MVEQPKRIVESNGYRIIIVPFEVEKATGAGKFTSTVEKRVTHQDELGAETTYWRKVSFDDAKNEEELDRAIVALVLAQSEPFSKDELLKWWNDGEQSED